MAGLANFTFHATVGCARAAARHGSHRLLIIYPAGQIGNLMIRVCRVPVPPQRVDLLPMLDAGGGLAEIPRGVVAIGNVAGCKILGQDRLAARMNGRDLRCQTLIRDVVPPDMQADQQDRDGCENQQRALEPAIGRRPGRGKLLDYAPARSWGTSAVIISGVIIRVDRDVFAGQVAGPDGCGCFA